MTSSHDNIKRPKRRNYHKVITALEEWVKDNIRKGVLPHGTRARWRRANDGEAEN